LAEQYLQRGLNHYDRGEVEAALTAYEQCVKADPAFGLGHNNLGMALIDLERYEDAVAELHEAIRCDPTYAEAYNNLGFVLRRMQRDVEAVSSYARFLELEPEVEEGTRIRSWMSTVLQARNLSAAPPFGVPPAPGAQPAPSAEPPVAPVPPVEEPLPEVPPLVPAPQPEAAPPAVPVAEPPAAARAVELPKLKKQAGWESMMPVPKPPQAPPEPAPQAPPEPAAAAQAPAVAEQVVAEMPAEAPVSAGPPPPADVTELIERGMDQFADGNLSESAAVFQQAVEAYPNNAEGHIGLAKVWVRQEKLPEAIALLERAADLDPSDPAAFYMLGFALRAVERNIGAAEAYERFLQLMPTAADGEKMREWITHVKSLAGRASGVFAEEIVDEEQIVTELDKKYKEALTRFQEGDTDTALRDCIRILQEDAGHIRTRVLLGRTYLRQKAYDDAIEQLENALVTRPDYPEALYLLGQAAEKRGVHDKTLASYKRYLEVAPGGPRAERLRDWLMSHGSPESPAGAARQAQCDLCLRFFPENEITQHEGRATCRNCLAVMGGTPTLSTPELTAAATKTVVAAPALPIESGPSRRSRGVVLVGVLCALISAAAVLFYMGKLNPLLERVGLRKPPPKIIEPPPDPGPDPQVPTFDAGKVKLVGEPQAKVRPFAQWAFTPGLEGLENLDTCYPGWTKEFTLKSAPHGMSVNAGTGAVSWLADLADADALKKGQPFTVELAVKATGKDPAGATKELFSISQTFALSCQFGYEFGPELDAGLDPNAHPVVAVGDFNGDGLADTVIAAGRFRAGHLDLHLQKKPMLLPPPFELDKGGRFSALYVGDVDGVKGDDLIAADWQHGRIKAYCQGEQGLTPAGEFAVGAGPVGLSVADVDGDKRPEIAALCSVGGQLVVTSFTAERKFSPVATIPLPGGGPTGFVFPWTSAELGGGVLAITPLAPSPLVFVPSNKGAWGKGPNAPVPSAMPEEGAITAAAVLNSSGGVRRVALILAGKESRLLVLEEKRGVFAAAGKPVVLPGLGLGLLAHDFNQDGQDDLLVVMLEECGFYFARGAEMLAGPRVPAPRLLGPVAKFGCGPAECPDVLLINENRKAQILKAVEAQVVTPADDGKTPPGPEPKPDVKAPDGAAPQAPAPPPETKPGAADQDGSTPLILAVAKGETAAVQELLAKGGDVNAKSKSGRTALMIAAMRGDAALVRALLAAGADVKAKSVNGTTALRYAAQQGNAEIVKLLESAGAKE